MYSTMDCLLCSLCVVKETQPAQLGTIFLPSKNSLLHKNNTKSDDDPFSTVHLSASFTFEQFMTGSALLVRIQSGSTFGRYSTDLCFVNDADGVCVSSSPL